MMYSFPYTKIIGTLFSVPMVPRGLFRRYGMGSNTWIIMRDPDDYFDFFFFCCCSSAGVSAYGCWTF